jgi:hypothetical protein
MTGETRNRLKHLVDQEKRRRLAKAAERTNAACACRACIENLPVTHGTHHAYNRYRCRCHPCKAHRRNEAKRYRRQQAKEAA